MLAEFPRDEGFQDPPEERTILLETTGVGTDKVAREPRIQEMDLRSFDQPLAQVGRPRGETLDQKDGFQQRDMPGGIVDTAGQRPI